MVFVFTKVKKLAEAVNKKSIEYNDKVYAIDSVDSVLKTLSTVVDNSGKLKIFDAVFFSFIGMREEEINYFYKTIMEQIQNMYPNIVFVYFKFKSDFDFEYLDIDFDVKTICKGENKFSIKDIEEAFSYIAENKSAYEFPNINVIEEQNSVLGKPKKDILDKYTIENIKRGSFVNGNVTSLIKNVISEIDYSSTQISKIDQMNKDSLANIALKIGYKLEDRDIFSLGEDLLSMDNFNKIKESPEIQKINEQQEELEKEISKIEEILVQNPTNSDMIEMLAILKKNLIDLKNCKIIKEGSDFTIAYKASLAMLSKKALESIEKAEKSFDEVKDAYLDTQDYTERKMLIEKLKETREIQKINLTKTINQFTTTFKFLVNTYNEEKEKQMLSFRQFTQELKIAMQDGDVERQETLQVLTGGVKDLLKELSSCDSTGQDLCNIVNQSYNGLLVKMSDLVKTDDKLITIQDEQITALETQRVKVVKQYDNIVESKVTIIEGLDKVGKSTIAWNTANYLSKNNFKVLLMDLDFDNNDLSKYSRKIIDGNIELVDFIKLDIETLRNKIKNFSSEMTIVNNFKSIEDFNYIGFECEDVVDKVLELLKSILDLYDYCIISVSKQEIFFKNLFKNIGNYILVSDCDISNLEKTALLQNKIVEFLNPRATKKFILNKVIEPLAFSGKVDNFCDKCRDIANIKDTVFKFIILPYNSLYIVDKMTAECSCINQNVFNQIIDI